MFFTNATAETAKSDFTVNGVTGKYRTLSTAEWQYLFNTRSNASNLYKYGVTVCGNANCVVLLPDGWTWDANTVGTDWQKNTSNKIEYSEETTVKWSTMEAAGAVCLPAAGYRNGSSVDYVGDGYYWSSTTYDSVYAYGVLFSSDLVLSGSDGNRSSGFSVRPVTTGGASDPGNGTEQYNNNSNPDWFSK